MSTIRSLYSTCLFILLAFAGTDSFASHLGCPDPSGYPSSSGCSLTGVRTSGFPYFDQGVNINYLARKDGDFFLKARYNKNSDISALVISALKMYDIEKTKISVKVKVEGGVAKGSVRIKGIIPELGMTHREKLMSAQLEGAWALSADGQLLGFNTMDIMCNDILPITCTEAESIYLTLMDAITESTKKLKTTGEAITTVPIPAALWLMGSGLLGLAGMARGKRSIQMS